MSNLKSQQRNQLILELGILIQPFVELVESSSSQPISKYRIASAKVQSGDSSWRNTARFFSTFGDDVFMHSEYQKISHVNEVFLREISALINEAEQNQDIDTLQSECEDSLKILQENFYKYISDIPVDWEPEIFPANTPFTSYLKIKDSLSLVRERIHYFDRYLKVEFFDTFLRDVNRSIEIRLVTTAGRQNYGVQGVQAISELARQEFSNYQLIQVNPRDLHDRNLRVDDLAFTLGPGIDRAGLALTNFGPTDSSVQAIASFDAIIGSGNVVHHS